MQQILHYYYMEFMKTRVSLLIKCDRKIIWLYSLLNMIRGSLYQFLNKLNETKREIPRIRIKGIFKTKAFVQIVRFKRTKCSLFL